MHILGLTNQQARKKVINKLQTICGYDRHRQLTANMTDEQVQAKRARERNENMTEEQVDARRARQLTANMTDEQVQAKRARERYENMTDEQARAKRARQQERYENMTEEQVQAKREYENQRNAKIAKAAREAAHAAMPKSSHPDIVIEAEGCTKAKDVFDKYGNVTLVHGTPVLMEYLKKPDAKKYESYPDCTLYSHASLRDSKKEPRHVAKKEKPHTSVYPTPSFHAALHHSRHLIKKGVTIDFHVIHANNLDWLDFHPVIGFPESAMFVKSANPARSDAIYRGRPGRDGMYVYKRIWQRDENGPFSKHHYL